MKPLIVALDVDTDKEALSLVKATKEFVDIYKVGPALVLRYGPDIFKKIRAARKKIFLDLKFHDIPNTILRSVSEAGKWDIFSATVHISAGERALQEAVKAKGRPELWGVTVLTSLSERDLTELGITTTPLEQVLRFAEIARRVSLNGVVASVGETVQLRRFLGKGIKIITPGIRLPEDAVGDQIRTGTPQHARASGSDYIVVGRPIIESKDPGQVAEFIMKDWSKSKADK
jgi:orotidine-5'-phosphate decarboxylase